MTMTHLSVVAFITAAIVMAAAAVACDGRREVVMEWPTPAVPVADIAYESVIRSAGSRVCKTTPILKVYSNTTGRGMNS